MERLALSCPGPACFVWKASGFHFHSSSSYQTWFKFPLSLVTFPESSSPYSRERERKKVETFPYYSSNNEFLLWVGCHHVFSVKCWWQLCWGTFPRGCGLNRWGLILTRAALAFPSSLALLSPEIRDEKWFMRSCCESAWLSYLFSSL